MSDAGCMWWHICGLGQAVHTIVNVYKSGPDGELCQVEMEKQCKLYNVRVKHIITVSIIVSWMIQWLFQRHYGYIIIYYGEFIQAIIPCWVCFKPNY